MIPAQKNKQLPSVHYIRAIASLAVAVFHLGGKVLPVLRWGWLGVDLFFVLSGFIICWSMPALYTLKSSGKFILKRLIRIEPPYIISLILLIALNFLTITNFHLQWGNLLLHFAYLNNVFNQPYLNPVYWTLGLEFQYYIFIAFAFPLIIKSYGKWLVLILSLLPLFFLPRSQTLINFFPLFAIGISIYLFLKNLLSKPEFLIFNVIICIAGASVLGWVSIITGIAAVIVILAPLKENSIVSFFSKISFSLYLTHDIIGSRLVIYLGNIFEKTIINKGLFFLTGIGVSILFAWLYDICIERPFLNYSKSITYS